MANITIAGDALLGFALALGLIVMAAGVVWGSWGKRTHRGGAAISVLVGVALIGVAVWGFAATPSATVTNPPCGAGSNPFVACPGVTHTATATVVPTALTGASWYATGTSQVGANTYFFGAVYNRTSSTFDTIASNSTGHGSLNSKISIPILLTRTDSGNQTVQFSITVTSVPTVFSTGSSPVQVSPIFGYNTGGGSQSQWQMKFDNGTVTGLPLGVAPGTSTNVLTNGLNVPAFGSAKTTLSFMLGGSVFSGTAQAFPYSAFLSSIGGSGTAAFDATITLGQGATFANGGSTITIEMWVYGSVA